MVKVSCVANGPRQIDTRLCNVACGQCLRYFWIYKRTVMSCKVKSTPAGILVGHVTFGAGTLWRGITALTNFPRFYTVSPAFIRHKGQTNEHEKSRGITYKQMDRQTYRQKKNNELYYTRDKRTLVNAP